MHYPRLALLIAVLVTCVAATDRATAATATVSGTGQSKVIQYTDAAGDANSIYAEVDQQSGKVRLFEQSFDAAVVISAGSGCTAEGSGGKSVLCSTQGVVSIEADMGGGDDSFQGYAAVPTVVNGGPGDDTLTGSPVNDTVDGGTGDDLIFDHGDGDGSDVVIGGDGFDTAVYSSHQAALHLSLDGVANDGAAGENDNVNADVEKLVGGPRGDTLIGTSGPDWLVGIGGGDILQGGGGDDTLDGSDSCSDPPDTLDAGAGNDTIAGAASSVDAGAGDDVVTADSICPGATLVGGTGHDELRFAPGFADDLSISLDDVANDGAGSNADANVASDFEELAGGSGRDILTASNGGTSLDGGGSSDLLTGGAGNDSIAGGTGDDVMEGGGGADVIQGGDGNDIVDYSSRSAPVQVDLGGAPGGDGELGEGDTVGSDVEGILGGSGNDVLTGGPGDDLLDGGPGADVLAGSEGNDTLEGGAGNDKLDGGTGLDEFFGDEGDDTIAMRDDVAEQAACGDGADSVTADASDETDADCETVDRPAVAPVTQPTPTGPTRTNPIRTPPVRTPVVRTPLAPPPPDRTAPTATVAPVKVKLKAALKGGIRFSVLCDEDCSTEIALVLSAKQLRRLGVRHAKHAVVVARGEHTFVDASAYHVVVRFTKSMRARLAKARSLKLEVRAVVSDLMDNRSRRPRSTLKLSR